MPKKPTKKIPTEDEESQIFSSWLTTIGLPHHHSANEAPQQKITGRRADGKPIWSRNWSTLRRLKNMGVAKGFPDYLVVVPKDRSSSKKALMIAIEMKRLKGGVTSPEQKVWLDLISQVNDCEGFVCKGFDEAKKTIEQFII